MAEKEFGPSSAGKKSPESVDKNAQEVAAKEFSEKLVAELIKEPDTSKWKGIYENWAQAIKNKLGTGYQNSRFEMHINTLSMHLFDKRNIKKNPQEGLKRFIESVGLKKVESIQSKIDIDRKKTTELFIANNPIEKFTSDRLNFAIKHSYLDIGKGINITGQKTLAEWKSAINTLDTTQLKKYLAVISTLEEVVKKKEFQDNIGLIDGAVDSIKTKANNALAFAGYGDKRHRDLSKDRLIEQIQKGLSIAISSGDTQYIEIGISEKNIETFQIYSVSSIRSTLMDKPETVNRKALQTLLGLDDWKNKLGEEGIQGIALYLRRRSYSSKILTELPPDKNEEITKYFKDRYTASLGLDVLNKEYDDSLFELFQKVFPSIGENGFKDVMKSGKLDPTKLLNLAGIPASTPGEAVASLGKIKNILLGFKLQTKVKGNTAINILEQQGIKTISDTVKKYNIIIPSTISGTRPIESLSSNEGSELLSILEKAGVPKNDPLYTYLQSKFKIDKVNSAIGTVIGTGIAIKEGGIKALEAVKSSNTVVIEQIKNASVLYSQNEGIIEQAKTTEKYYNDILQAYGLRSSDLENPAIAENLYKKLNEKTTRTQKENDFLQVLKGIIDGHHIRTRSIVMISNSIGNPSDTMNFLNEVTESKIFTEKSLIAYKALDRYEQFPAERPTDVNVFEKKVAYMKEGAVYSAEDLGIKGTGNLNTGLLDLPNYSFSTMGSSGVCIKEGGKTLIEGIAPASVESFLTQVQVMRSCGLDGLTYDIPFINKITSSGERVVNSLDTRFGPNEAIQLLEKTYLLIFGKPVPPTGNLMDLINEFNRANPNKSNRANGVISILREKGLATDTGAPRIFAIEESIKNLT